MTIAEELYRAGIPEDECEPLAKKLMNAAAASGHPNALENMLYCVRFLISQQRPLIPHDAAIRALNLNSGKK